VAGAEFMDALFGGLKRVGDAGVDVGKAVAEIPLNIVTAIPDFVKDPDVFLSGGRLGAVGALLSKDYRTKQKADLTAAREWDKFQKTRQAVDWATELFSDTPFAQRHTAVAQATQAGVSDDLIEQSLAQASGRDQRARIAREGVATALPDIPPELVAETNFTPEQAVATIVDANNAKADDAYRDSRAAIADANAAKRLTLAERREQRLKAQPPAQTPEEKEARRRLGRKADYAFKSTTEQLEQGLPGAIAGITDPTLAGSLRAKMPSHIAEEADKAAAEIMAESQTRFGQKKRLAKREIKKAIPLKSRKDIAARREAEAAVDAAMPVGLDSPILDDSPLPTDPSSRLALADSLGQKLIEAGFPPDKAAAELLRRGFTPEELPE
jgi:hypothetical protein